MKRMKRLSLLGILLGLALVMGLVMGLGWRGVVAGLQSAGGAVFWLPVYYLVPLGCALLSWWYLFPRRYSPRSGGAPSLPRHDVVSLPPSLSLTAYCIWINFAINWLLPVAQVGGEIARIRLLLKRQFPPGEAIASVIGDQTLQLVSQALYAMLGILLLGFIQLNPPVDAGPTSIQFWLRLGLSLIVLLGITAGFYWVQHQGLFKLFSRVAHKFPALLPGGPDQMQETATQIDQAVVAMYQRRDRLLIASVWRCGFRLLAAGETWLALRFLNHPVGLGEAIALESLGQAIRSAAFLIPGGLGVQEVGIMGIGSVLGIPNTVGLNLSLCKRIRELAIGVPGLMALQVEEGRALWPNQLPK
ncbi:MAG: lysylphosphatidylglycerol synthase domain-containing protein [Leptolyngbyaceae cyanobacterium]